MHRHVREINHLALDNNPIVYNWFPVPPMSPFVEMEMQFMCLLDEAKTPRRYQRDIVKLVNKLLAVPADDDGNFLSFICISVLS